MDNIEALNTIIDKIFTLPFNEFEVKSNPDNESMNYRLETKINDVNCVLELLRPERITFIRLILNGDVFFVRQLELKWMEVEGWDVKFHNIVELKLGESRNKSINIFYKKILG